MRWDSVKIATESHQDLAATLELLAVERSFSSTLPGRVKTLAIGDHLRVKFGCYFHHAIDLSDGTVVHFGQGLHDLANAQIERVDLDQFAQGREIERLNSPINFTGQEVADRALSRLGERDYRVFGNNCEGFVHWCRAGQDFSFQAEVVRSTVGQIAAVVAKPSLARRFTGAIVAAGPIPEVVQLSVETWFTRRTHSAQHGRRMGKVCGAATAFVIGFVKGGPASAVVTTSVWAGGQVAGEHMAQRTTQILDNLCTLIQRRRTT